MSRICNNICLITDTKHCRLWISLKPRTQIYQCLVSLSHPVKPNLHSLKSFSCTSHVFFSQLISFYYTKLPTYVHSHIYVHKCYVICVYANAKPVEIWMFHFIAWICLQTCYRHKIESSFSLYSWVLNRLKLFVLLPDIYLCI